MCPHVSLRSKCPGPVLSYSAVTHVSANNADEAAFTADVQAFELERAEQAALVKEHSGFKSGFESAIVSAAGGSVTASMRQTASAVCASGVRVLCSQQRMWTASGTGKHRAERFPLHCGYLL